MIPTKIVHIISCNDLLYCIVDDSFHTGFTLQKRRTRHKVMAWALCEDGSVRPLVLETNALGLLNAYDGYAIEKG